MTWTSWNNKDLKHHVVLEWPSHLSCRAEEVPQGIGQEDQMLLVGSDGFLWRVFFGGAKESLKSILANKNTWRPWMDYALCKKWFLLLKVGLYEICCEHQLQWSLEKVSSLHGDPRLKPNTNLRKRCFQRKTKQTKATSNSKANTKATSKSKKHHGFLSNLPGSPCLSLLKKLLPAVVHIVLPLTPARRLPVFCERLVSLVFSLGWSGLAVAVCFI